MSVEITDTFLDLLVHDVFTPTPEEVKAVVQQLIEYKQTFELQRRRMGEATKMWRKANPGNEMVLPDLGQLLEWLMGEVAKSKNRECPDRKLHRRNRGGF